MMGSTEDPKDGNAVAATVFFAVAVYGVSSSPLGTTGTKLIRIALGIPHILRKPGIPTHPRVETGSNRIVMK